MEAQFSKLSFYPSNSLSQYHTKFPTFARSRIYPFAPTVPFKFPPCTLLPINRQQFQLNSTVETATIEEKLEKTQLQVDARRKLYVLNLPWSLSVTDIKNMFGECGGVDDVEIIKQKVGRSQGFASVTMASGEEAGAVIEKFDSYELSGRIIRVEFSKRFEKPPSPSPSQVEAPHKLYVANVAWKVRSNDLREFFLTKFNPVSVKVVFNNPSGKSAGYGFVSFVTKEEAELAISELNGKELLGRPISLKFTENSANSYDIKKEESIEEQPQDSSLIGERSCNA